MRKVILWTVAAAFLLGVFETAILSHIQLLPALPDLILILVVYIALYNGTVVGIMAGVLSGLIFDFLSLFLPCSGFCRECCTENIIYADFFSPSYSGSLLLF